jgi:hypothetical protein
VRIYNFLKKIGTMNIDPSFSIEIVESVLSNVENVKSLIKVGKKNVKVK